MRVPAPVAHCCSSRSAAWQILIIIEDWLDVRGIEQSSVGHLRAKFRQNIAWCTHNASCDLN